MRLYTFTGLLIAAALASGCMSNVKDGFSYDCSGAGKGWGDCHAKADAQCGANNYTVISGEGGAQAKDSGNTEMKRVLVVKCK